MRHFRSILYALVLAPVVWVLAAAGLTHDLTARGRDGFAVESLTGLVLVLLAGAAYGILVFAPISPLGPVVAGVVFLGAGVWAVEWPTGYAGLWPGGGNDGFDLGRPGHGPAALLAVPLILTALSVRRWSGFEPVVLPFIGPVGRTRGAAGAPSAAPQTALLPGFEANVEDERTTLIRMPGADVVPEATTVLFRPDEDTSPDEGEQTTVLRAPAPAADEPATEDVAAGTEEPTDTIADEQPTGDVLDEPPTEPTATVNDEPTDAITDEPATEDFAGPPAEEPTVSLDDEPEPERAAADEPEPTQVIAAEADETVDAGDEKTVVVVPPADATDEATEVAEVSSGAEPAAAVVDEPATDEEPVTSVLASTESGPPTNEEAPVDEPLTAVLTLAEEEQLAGDGSPAPDESAEDDGTAVSDVAAAGEEPAAVDEGPTAVDERSAAVDEAAADSGPVTDDEPATSVLTPAGSETPASDEALGDEAARTESPVSDDGPIVGDEAPVAEPVGSDSAPTDSDDSAEDWVTASAAAPDGTLAVDDGDEDEVLVEETTYLLMPTDDDARTQAMQLAAELEADGERTQVIRPVRYEPGQTTRDLSPPGDRTQVIWPANRRAPGETTRAIGGPGEQTRRIVRSAEKVAGLDETQLIRLPDPADDGARTQVIRSGQVTPPAEHLPPPDDDAEPTLTMPAVDPGPAMPPGEEALVTPPADRVEPLRIPSQRTDPDENPAELTQLLGEKPPPAPPSIARAESPNFAEDPTGRIIPPTLPLDEPTRTMTVMNIERPPEEVPEIPSQRKPPDED